VTETGRDLRSSAASIAAVASLLASGSLQAEGVAFPRAELRGPSPCVRVLAVELPCAVPPIDVRAELLARLAQAIRALEAGDERAAIGQFRALATFYRRGGDHASAAAAELQAARLFVSTESYDEALATLARTEGEDPADARAGEREHVRVVALERKGDVRSARARLIAARRAYPPGLWDTYLADDAQRLGVASDRPLSAGGLAGLILAFEWLGLAALAAGAWLRAPAAGRRQRRASRPDITDPQNEK
jgi:hypothetical protein